MLDDFLTLLFPPICSLCGQGRLRSEAFLCSSCLVQLPREMNYQGLDNSTTSRIRGMFPFQKALSFLRFRKGGTVQKLLHLVKYRSNPSLGTQLGRWFAAEERFFMENRFDYIVPVPLHPERMKSRGYNQCQVIAEGISSVTGRPVLNLLRRVHAADTQTQLSRWDRFENTANEFRLIDQQVVNRKSILLLDDIITTGATMAGAAMPLLRQEVTLSIAALALTQDS